MERVAPVARERDKDDRGAAGLASAALLSDVQARGLGDLQRCEYLFTRKEAGGTFG